MRPIIFYKRIFMASSLRLSKRETKKNKLNQRIFILFNKISNQSVDQTINSWQHSSTTHANVAEIITLESPALHRFRELKTQFPLTINCHYSLYCVATLHENTIRHILYCVGQFAVVIKRRQFERAKRLIESWKNYCAHTGDNRVVFRVSLINS